VQAESGRSWVQRVSAPDLSGYNRTKPGRCRSRQGQAELDGLLLGQGANVTGLALASKSRIS